MKASARKGSERFCVVEFTNPSGATAYRVTGRTAHRKRIRENFRTHGEAVARKSELEIESANLESAAKPLVTRLTVDQLAVAERAFDRLAGKPLLDAVEYYLKNFSEPDRRLTVADAFARFIGERKAANLRPLSIRNLESKCAELVNRYGSRQVAEVNADALRPLIFKPTRGAKARDNHRRALNAFFAWALKQRFCASNPVAAIDRIRVDRDEPAILSPEQTETLLQAAQAHKGGVLVPYIALAMFAGLRPTELARLEWAKIDLASKTITIGSTVAKMRGRRIVEMEENLVEWLRPFAKGKTPIVGTNWRKDFDAVKQAAGFGTPTDDRPHLQPWTQDIMRHTGISFHLAKHQHEGKTAAWAGNSPDIIQRHYKGLVSPADVSRFWSIVPKLPKGKIAKVNFKQNAA